jgi:immunoglobulin-binding protein 1
MNGHPQTLHSIFAAAKSQKCDLESSLETNSDSYHSEVNAAVLKFEECKQLISQLSLFSPNESLEDIATGDLQYCCDHPKIW